MEQLTAYRARTFDPGTSNISSDQTLKLHFKESLDQPAQDWLHKTGNFAGFEPILVLSLRWEHAALLDCKGGRTIYLKRSTLR